MDIESKGKDVLIKGYTLEKVIDRVIKDNGNIKLVCQNLAISRVTFYKYL